jgi:hypothetical protein
MLYISLGISAVFLVIVNLLARRRGGSGMSSAIAFSGVVASFSLFAMMGFSIPAVIYTAGLVAVVGFICWLFGSQPRYFALASVVVTLFAHVFAGWSGLDEIRRWEEMKSQYPLESLDDRLAYETRPHSINPAHRSSLDPTWLDTLEKASDKHRNEFSTKRYLGSLERLHAGATKQFVESQGFGAGRLPFRPSTWFLREPRKPPLLEDVSTEYFHQSSPIPWSVDQFPDPPRDGDAQEREAHRGNILGFLEPWDLGYARDRQHVAGFRPHAFHIEPTSPSDWRLNRLDLVGILKFDEPVVYLTPSFPRMEEVQTSPTRPLDPFETEALAALLRGEDLVARESARHLRLFGSLRATKQCLACHHGERGDLLGAFSYQLSR